LSIWPAGLLAVDVAGWVGGLLVGVFCANAPAAIPSAAMPQKASIEVRMGTLLVDE
jgi:hypothetical protein